MRQHQLGTAHSLGIFLPSRLLFTRIILSLTVLMLVLLPVLEHFCTWDNFFFGGEDIEFGLLCLLVFIGLLTRMANHAAAVPYFARWLIDRVKYAMLLLAGFIAMLMTCIARCAPLHPSLDAPLPGGCMLTPLRI